MSSADIEHTVSLLREAILEPFATCWIYRRCLLGIGVVRLGQFALVMAVAICHWVKLWLEVLEQILPVPGVAACKEIEQ